jgi:S-adenosylmethionine:tRNA ribosyltransferase-isomerase
MNPLYSSGSPGSTFGSEDPSEPASYDYVLPEDRIRLVPPEERGDSRLLVSDRAGVPGSFRVSKVGDLTDWLRPEDLLVVNDSRVFPARLFGTSESGRHVEIVFLSEEGSPDVPFLGRGLGKHPGRVILPKGGALDEIRYVEEEGRLEGVYSGPMPLPRLLEECGEMPLPPYIRRKRDYRPEDRERYQTVYSRTPGSVAAPTAGLHLTEGLLSRAEAMGVGIAAVTLHVGIGTFRPLGEGGIGRHRMHSERYAVPEETVAKMQKAKDSGGRIFAVGTTVVRTLETWARTTPGRKGEGWTDLFIRPGFPFLAVDGLMTNFHQPRSTLLVLVDAFLGGTGRWREIYRFALSQGFFFLSYGDALLILPENTDGNGRHE